MTQDVPRTGEIEVLTALAAGRSVTDAAEAGGVSRRTVSRWLGEPDFRGEVNRLRGELLSQTVNALANGAVEAVTTLRASLVDGSEAVKVRAAGMLLSNLPTTFAAFSFDERLAQLEAVAAERAVP